MVCKNVDNSKNNDEIKIKIKEQEELIRRKYSLESLSDLPKINIWREAYLKFNAKPKDNKSSVENLYQLVLRGIKLKPISALVDTYNFVSLKYMIPLGGEDVDMIKGDLRLTFAGENEEAVLLLGDKEARAPHVGEIIYRDAISTICRRWNWREAERTKLTENTKNCILILEGLPPFTKQGVKMITEELKELIKKYCGGEIKCLILDKENREVLI
ncbi:hypothetical protein HYT55_03270 [Candidatus Woesearchaeota archaeon]|nr:hypothetical protein [Candidatus Woesearchaeota archaeon]